MRTLPVALTLLSTAALAATPTAAWAQDHNPPGNNGTVKIDGAPFDGGHGNEPHVGCVFHLDFFGFDAGQTATITFTGQAPTKLGTLLTQSGVAISDDAAGGGKDTDAVLSYSAQQLGLTGQPAAEQGWHVKVAVDADNAPGGAKQKVFWLSCPGAAPDKQTASSSGAGDATTSTTSTPPTRTQRTPRTAHSTGTTVTRVSGVGAGAVTASVPLAPTYGSGVLSTAGGGAVRSRSTSSGLPFTGDQTGTLLLVGASTLGAGGTLTVVGRRRRTTG